MANLKMELVDSDYVVRAKMDLTLKGDNGKFGEFFKEIDDELVTGKTAHLEIEGLKKNPVTFEISKIE